MQLPAPNPNGAWAGGVGGVAWGASGLHMGLKNLDLLGCFVDQKGPEELAVQDCLVVPDLSTVYLEYISFVYTTTLAWRRTRRVQNSLKRDPFHRGPNPNCLVV